MNSAMSVELKVLVLSVILGLLQLVLATSAATLQRSLKWNLSSRDDVKPPLSGMAGRLSRAFENFKETFVFFAIVVLVVHMLGKNSSTSAMGAELYLIARAVYVAAYAFNIVYIRTVIWGASMVGLIMVLTQIFT